MPFVLPSKRWRRIITKTLPSPRAGLSGQRWKSNGAWIACRYSFRIRCGSLLSAKDLLDETLQSGDLTLIDIQVGGMKTCLARLWIKATKPATCLIGGYLIRLPVSNRVVAIVKTSAEAHADCQTGSGNMDDHGVAQLIDGMDESVANQTAFPRRKSPPSRKRNPIQQQDKPVRLVEGDDIPF